MFLKVVNNFYRDYLKFSRKFSCGIISMLHETFVKLFLKKYSKFEKFAGFNMHQLYFYMQLRRQHEYSPLNINSEKSLSSLFSFFQFPCHSKKNDVIQKRESFDIFFHIRKLRTQKRISFLKYSEEN